MAVRPLLRLTKPYKDECLCGYLLRLSELNHYDSLRWILKLANISTYSSNINLLVYGKHELDYLSDLIQVEKGILWSMAFPTLVEGTLSNYVRAFDSSIPIYLIRKDRANICPICLASSTYCRKIWNLSIVTTCPIHKCLLLDYCPFCREKITWKRSSVFKCRKCDCDWREYSSEKLDTSEVALSTLIHSLCNDSLVEYQLERELPLLNLDLRNLATLVSFFAGQLVNLCDTTGKFISTSYTNRDLHILLVKVFEVFNDWPTEFYNFLDELRTMNFSHNRDTGISKEFGSFYKKLYTSFSDEVFTFLHEAFESYLIEQWDGGYLNSKLSRISENIHIRRNFIPATEAAQSLGVKPEWILKFIKQGTLDGITKKMGKRQLILVRRSSLKSLKSVLDSTLTLNESAQLLGISAKAVLDLVNHSCLKAIRGPGEDGYTQWLISSESLSGLFDSLDLQVKVRFYSECKMINFSSALRKLTGLGFTTGRLVYLILEGILQPCVKTEASGLDRYLLLESEVEEILHKTISKEKENHLSVSDVAQILHVKQEVAAFWIDKGFLPCEKKLGESRCRREIPKSSIQPFRETYISAVHLAQVMHTSPKKSVQLLMNQNIMPISGPKIDGGRQYLFCRSDVEAFLSNSYETVANKLIEGFSQDTPTSIF